MKMQGMAFALLSVLILVGCATTEGRLDVATSDDVFAQSEVDFDPYERTTWIYSPRFRAECRNRWEGSYTVRLRALVTDGSVRFYQVYVTSTYEDYGEGLRSYDHAYDANGNGLSLKKIDFEMPSWCKETVAIDLSREYLKGAKNTGLNIKVYGRNGDFVFYLPAFYVEGFLRKVDECTGDGGQETGRHGAKG